MSIVQKIIANRIAFLSAACLFPMGVGAFKLLGNPPVEIQEYVAIGDSVLIGMGVTSLIIYGVCTIAASKQNKVFES